MPNLRSFGLLGAATVLLGVPAFSSAATLVLRRDTVLPVVFGDSLTVRENRTGDRFTVRVEDSSQAPRGTRLEGRIVAMRESRGGRPASMDLEFTDIVMPDGTRRALRAVPIPLNDANVSRDRDGRLVVRRDPRKTEKFAIGGALGGLVLGALGKKPVEGAIIGAIAGAVVGEASRKEDETTVVRRGQKMGALIDRDVRIEFRDRDSDRWDDEDRDRDDDDRYDDRDRDRDRDRDDDRYDDRDERIVIEHADRELRFSDEEAPYREGNTIMVPLKRVADQLGLEVEDGRYKAIYVSGDKGSLRLEMDSSQARLNGKTTTLAHAVVDRDGVVYVPLDALAGLAKERITANGNRIDSRTY
ncbi:MAG: copper amine oxidase N-terminal domain-containing protein [Fimbriimonas sp.]